MADASPMKRSRPEASTAAAAAAAAAAASTSTAGEQAAVVAETGGSAKPVLFSYWRSSCSWRVRIALNLLGLEYEYKAVHLVKGGGEQFLSEYTDKNPMREVPTLLIDGRHLTQSLSIIEYLNETRKGDLLPGGPAERQKVRAIADLIAQGIQAVQNLRVLVKAMELVPEDQKTATKIGWGKHWISQGFEALEKTLASTAGTFCVGDVVSMADACLVPQVYNAQRFGVDMAQFPTIVRINAHCAKLPAFAKAHPDAQPDSE